MIKNSFIIVCLLVLFFSCKKDAAITLPAINTFNNNTATSQDTMLPLVVGDYWIYQKSQDDSIGTYTLQNDFDSVYVEKDSMIMNEHYFKIAHTNSSFVYYFNFGNYIWVKDSLGYLVNYPHNILLDTVHLLDTLSTESYGSGQYGKMVPDTFLNRNFLIGNYSGFWMRKCFLYPITLNHFNGTYCYQAFVKNVGLIRARMLFTGFPYHSMWSYHLIRYHLN